MDKAVDEVDNFQQKNAEKSILGIFAKQPVPGGVKTRLCPPLNFGQAAALYAVALRETVHRMQSGSSYDLAICYDGDPTWFKQTFPGCRLVPQRGADLGQRMANALAGFLEEDYRHAALIGSDAPDLPLKIVEQAFNRLTHSDLVLGPAVDGGYYLVAEKVHHPELFENIPWSTGDVFRTTLTRAENRGISTACLDSWEDLDDLAALRRFQKRSPQSKTALYLSSELAGCLSN